MPSWLRALWKPRIILPVVVVLLAMGTGVAWGSWQNLCADCPSVAQIRTWQPQQTSKIYSHDGRLISELGVERRTPVSINSLPDYVPQAVVSIEDQRFYQHGGFDVRGFLRAASGRLTGRNRGGGSTITQQLARNMFDEQIGFERHGWAGYFRKLKELQVALELERSYTKDQILEAYLNEIYMGPGFYGFQAAARGYLGKDITDVNPAEAALLAAILNVPGLYNPFTHPENARRRRNLVLDRMADQGYLTPADAARWKKEPLPSRDDVAPPTQDIAPYFTEWVRQLLESRFGSQIYQGGFRVTTTLDVDMQRMANETMRWGWQRIEALPNFDHPKYADFDTVKSFPGQTPYLQGMFDRPGPRHRRRAGAHRRA